MLALNVLLITSSTMWEVLSIYSIKFGRKSFYLTYRIEIHTCSNCIPCSGPSD